MNVLHAFPSFGAHDPNLRHIGARKWVGILNHDFAGFPWTSLIKLRFEWMVRGSMLATTSCNFTDAKSCPITIYCLSIWYVSSCQRSDMSPVNVVPHKIKPELGTSSLWRKPKSRLESCITGQWLRGNYVRNHDESGGGESLGAIMFHGRDLPSTSQSGALWTTIIPFRLISRCGSFDATLCVESASN